MSKLSRKNIFMSNQIAQWYEETSKETGMSQSALMVMALHSFMTQQKALEMNDTYKQLTVKIDNLNTEK